MEMESGDLVPVEPSMAPETPSQTTQQDIFHRSQSEWNPVSSAMWVTPTEEEKKPALKGLTNTNRRKRHAVLKDLALLMGIKFRTYRISELEITRATALELAKLKNVHILGEYPGNIKFNVRDGIHDTELKRGKEITEAMSYWYDVLIEMYGSRQKRMTRVQILERALMDLKSLRGKL